MTTRVSPRNNNYENIKQFIIPGDMLMDVLEVIVRNKLRFELDDVVLEEYVVKVTLYTDAYSHEALKNISAMLVEFHDMERIQNE